MNSNNVEKLTKQLISEKMPEPRFIKTNTPLILLNNISRKLISIFDYFQNHSSVY